MVNAQEGKREKFPLMKGGSRFGPPLQKTKGRGRRACVSSESRALPGRKEGKGGKGKEKLIPISILGGVRNLLTGKGERKRTANSLSCPYRGKR